MPEEKRGFVTKVLENAIKNYDTLIHFGFEFQAPKYQEGITDALKNAETIDEVVEIHNQVATMLTESANLIQSVGHEAAKPTIKAQIRNFIAKYDGQAVKTLHGTGGGNRVIHSGKSFT